MIPARCLTTCEDDEEDNTRVALILGEKPVCGIKNLLMAPKIKLSSGYEMPVLGLGTANVRTAYVNLLNPFSFPIADAWLSMPDCHPLRCGDWVQALRYGVCPWKREGGGRGATYANPNGKCFQGEYLSHDQGKSDVICLHSAPPTPHLAMEYPPWSARCASHMREAAGSTWLWLHRSLPNALPSRIYTLMRWDSLPQAGW